MVSGQTGNHGEIVLLRVVVVANHDQERVPILYQPMVVKIALEIRLKQEVVRLETAQVRYENYKYDFFNEFFVQCIFS